MSLPVMSPDTEKAQRGTNIVTMVAPMGAPSSPAHSDSETSNSSLEIGTNTTEELPQLSCRWQNCGRWFSSLEKLSGHVARFHAAPGPRGLFYCEWEGCARGERGFNARYKMLVHVRTHTNEKPHQCFQCDKSFSRAENLKIHARSHTGERPYVCPVEGCNKAYSNSSDRFKHTRTHAVDKPYCCKVPGCPKRYTDPSSLRKHVKTYRHYVNNSSNSPGSHPLASSKIGVDVITTQMASSGFSDPRRKDSSFESGISSSTSLSDQTNISLDPHQKSVDWGYASLPPVKTDYELDHYESNYAVPFHPQHISSPLDCYQPVRIGMQSTPIKSEDKANSGVNYRNIDSIINGTSTPIHQDSLYTHRNSVIQRADAFCRSQMSPLDDRMVSDENGGYQSRQDDSGHCKEEVKECCCRHKCCRRAENGALLEKTKILSDLLMKANNPVFRHILASVNTQYDLQRTWGSESMVNSDNNNAMYVNCAQNLPGEEIENFKIKITNQDLPLDLTINK